MSERWQLQQSRLQPIHVFLSSPGDVADERGLAHTVAAELSAEPFLRNRAVGRIVSWDDPAAPAPMLADRTPQASVTRARMKPSECDIVVVVLWTRLGTPLPDEHRKTDGGTYSSGTEWEYEDALVARPRPYILVYRRTEKVLLDADNPEDAAKLVQREQVRRFLARFRNPDGSLGGGFTKYGTPSAFAERLKTDLRELIATRLEEPFRSPARDTELLPGAAAAELWSGSPYPGLRSFKSREASIFFGRGREVDVLLLLLGATLRWRVFRLQLVRHHAAGYTASVASGSSSCRTARGGLQRPRGTGSVEPWFRGSQAGPYRRPAQHDSRGD